MDADARPLDPDALAPSAGASSPDVVPSDATTDRPAEHDPSISADPDAITVEPEELEPSVEPDSSGNPRRSVIISLVAAAFSIGIFFLFPFTIALPGMALALLFVSIFAEITSVQFDGKLTVSGWDCCCLLAVAFCSPWAGAAMAVVAMCAGYLVAPYRAEALLGNITGMAFATAVGAACFELIDPAASEYTLFLIAVGVLSVVVVLVNILFISLAFGVMDGFSFGQMLVRLRSVMPLIIFQAAFAVSVSALVLKYSPEVGVFASFLVATCNYIAHLIVSERESDRQAAALHQLAYRDALTGLPARRSWDEGLPGMLNRSAMAILFVDVVKFKQVNDTYGHETGDVMLIALGKRLQAAMRQEDLAARIAGDEFVACINLNTLGENRAREYAAAATERIERSINGPVEIDDRLTLPLTVSIGVAVYPFDAREPSELQRLADEAMYVYKKRSKSGRR